MTRQDAVVLASRTLSVLLLVWALTEASYLPDRVYAFLHYSDQVSVFSPAAQYWHHYHLISLSFLIIRIVGYALTARWLLKCGPEVEELLLGASETRAVRG
jgi:hypothetical protein